jgi:formylglycine-generating enzyme required for sulfatase activity/dienelactone hydrolase/tRNA A-37 threonylcarbamoyl transferase component Bud32
MIGQQITHYRVLSELGKGGMGVVYLAEDTTLDRRVALKFIRSDLIGGQDAEARLLREARAASALDHPNIGTIYEVGEWQGHHFIAMAHYAGETLAARAERGPLPIADATAILVQVAHALVRAHASGIVHRDLKPANIFLVPREAPRRGSGASPAAAPERAMDSAVTAKLLDFGLARQASEESTAATRLTAPGTTVGTVAYMSPEQARGEDVDASADLWAFGVIAYELVSGRRPFPGGHPATVLHAILYEPAPDLKSLRPDVPERLRALVAKALAKERAVRYQSADALLAELLATTEGGTQRPSLATRLRSPRVALPLGAGLLLAVGLGALAVARARQVLWARHQALPEIARLAEEEHFVQAFALAERAEKAIPSDPMLARLWPAIARTPELRSEPAGATVSYKEYDSPEAAWVAAGVTPVTGVRVPAGFFRWRFEKQGFKTLEVAGASGPLGVVRVVPWVPEVVLEAASEATPEMILVPGSDEPGWLVLPGFEHLKPVALSDAFWMDQYEVTNERFKAFVDASGYQMREFWLEPFEESGRALSWDEATARFRDATGRPGPANWVQGEFPAGQGQWPVSGVSWYEAAAYARFVGKRLPTIYHWNRAATARASPWVVPRANFSTSGPVPVGSRDALHQWGHHDLAGNVKEWVSTGPGDGRRYVLGGGWDEPRYMFNEPDARSPFARTANFGFRCVRYAREPAPELTAPVAWSTRDYRREKPAPDAVFEIYRRLYAYDRVPLQAPVEATEDHEHWRREQVSVPTAYGPERMKIFVYLPKSGAPPFRTVVYFPGATALRTRSLDQLALDPFDFIVKSGRAVVLPVYKGTLDRPTDVSDSTANATAGYRDHLIAWAKDFMRAVDYLETRPDLTLDRLAFVGTSWGARMGSIVPALDDRVKLAVLYVGGFSMQQPMPEVDQIHFAPRARIPVLMLNGRFDFFFPVDASQRPMFETLGAPKEHKRHVLYDTGHGIPRAEMIRETLDWLDRYQPAPSAAPVSR